MTKLFTIPAAAAAALIKTSAVGSQTGRPVPANIPLTPSVRADEYPKLVECTLAKRAGDIEAMFIAQDRFHEQARREYGLLVPKAKVDAVKVNTSARTEETAARLFVQIVETCQNLQVGRPLGFWPDQLIGDWRARMGMPWGLESNNPENESAFAQCLKNFRPKLVQTYLSQNSGQQRRSIYSSFFEQPVQNRFSSGDQREASSPSTGEQLTNWRASPSSALSVSNGWIADV
jgi:hypothetical protein